MNEPRRRSVRSRMQTIRASECIVMLAGHFLGSIEPLAQIRIMGEVTTDKWSELTET